MIDQVDLTFKLTGTMCPVCNNHSHFLFEKSGAIYNQCHSCEMIFAGELNNADMVGGEYEVERNNDGNHIRLARLEKMLRGQKDGVKILDFGCGHGLFVDYMKENGWDVEGYDLYSEKYSWPMPKRNYYHIVMMTEVIEHTSAPFGEVNKIHSALVMGGCLMVETSFTDIAKRDNIPLEEFFYINPKVGHSTIFSHHALDVLMSLRGFVPFEHCNANIRNFKKSRP